MTIGNAKTRLIAQVYFLCTSPPMSHSRYHPIFSVGLDSKSSAANPLGCVGDGENLEVYDIWQIKKRGTPTPSLG